MMRIDVYNTVPQVDPAVVSGSVAAVVDVIRATSTIVEALANGVRAIYPTDSTEGAIRLASSLGREETLLCGERKGLRVEGFDLGNSPREFTPDVAADKQLVMSTTNGTRAFLAAENADRVVSTSFLNLSAVARSVAGAERLVVVCAGREDRFSLDDVVCAGQLIDAILASGVEADMNDAARAALLLGRSTEVDTAFLAGTAAGQALVDVGLAKDLAVCADRDRHELVPEMDDRMIRIPG